MQNASCIFGFLTQNWSWTRRQFLILQTPFETGIEEISVRYADFIILRSMFKGTVDRK